MARFVILEHTWNGTHWDLMLETQGALRTWALEAMPDAQTTKIRARQLPDHRLAYLSYEGPISGERGTVRRIDEGQYQILQEGPGELEIAFEGKFLFGLRDLRLIAGIETGLDKLWEFTLIGHSTTGLASGLSTDAHR